MDDMRAASLISLPWALKARAASMPRAREEMREARHIMRICRRQRCFAHTHFGWRFRVRGRRESGVRRRPMKSAQEYHFG